MLLSKNCSWSFKKNCHFIRSDSDPVLLDGRIRSISIWTRKTEKYIATCSKTSNCIGTGLHLCMNNMLFCFKLFSSWTIRSRLEIMKWQRGINLSDTFGPLYFDMLALYVGCPALLFKFSLGLGHFWDSDPTFNKSITSLKYVQTSFLCPLYILIKLIKIWNI